MVPSGKENHLITKLLSYLTDHPSGANIHEIATSLDLNRNNAAKYLSILNLMGRVEVWTEGNKRVFRLAHRVPFHVFSIIPHLGAIGLNRSLLVTDIAGLADEILGCIKSDLIGQSFSELSHPVFQEKKLRELVKGVLDGKISTLEEFESHIMGRVYQITIVPCIFDEGSIGVALLLNELSHELDTRFEDHSLAERYRALMEETEEYIVDLDADDRIVRVNNALARSFETSSSELIGTKGLPSVFHDDMEIIKRSANDNSAPVKVKVVMPDGSVHWQKWRVHPEQKDGVILGLHCIGSDITNITYKKTWNVPYESGIQAISGDTTEELRDIIRIQQKEIDALKRREQDLKQSKERHQRLTDTLHDITWETGEDHQFTHVCPAVQVILGYECEFLQGKKIFDLIDDSLLDTKVFEFVSLLILGEPFTRFHTSIRRNDGSIARIEISGVPTIGADGSFEGYFGVIRDISVQFEEEEKNRDLIAIIESTSDIIATTKQDGSFRYLNPAGRSFFGIDKESDVSLINLFTFIPPDYLDKYLARREEAFQTGVWEGETMMLDVYGISNSMSQIIHFHQHVPEKSSFYSTIARNMSDRASYEEELAHAYSYTRTLLEINPDLLVTIGPDGMIRDVNKATERVLGHTRHKIIGTDFSQYFTDPEKVRAGYQQVFSKGSVKDYPLEILHRSGRITPVLYNAVVYRDGKGTVRGVFATAREMEQISKNHASGQRTEGSEDISRKPPPEKRKIPETGDESYVKN